MTTCGTSKQDLITRSAAESDKRRQDGGIRYPYVFLIVGVRKNDRVVTFVVPTLELFCGGF